MNEARMTRMPSRSKAPPPTNTWGVVTIGASKVPVRWIIMWVGLAGWLAVTFIMAGVPNGITAFSFNVSVIVGLVLAFGFTRSIPLRTVALMFFTGGVLLGAAILIEHAFDAAPLVSIRGLAVPIIEQILLVIPILIYFWFCRRFSLWTFAISDCMLMGASLGAGFAFVHDSFKHVEGWHHSIQWLPTADLAAQTYLVSGYAVWNGIAGAAIGGALVFLHKRQIGLCLASAGLAWGIIDHLGASNFNSIYQMQAQIVQLITARGYLTPYIFAGCVYAAILIDCWLKFKWCPKAEEFKLPKRSDTAASGLTGLWDFVLDKRRLCYANFHRMHLKGNANASMTVAIIAQALINKHSPERMSQLFETMSKGAGEKTFLATGLAEELLDGPLLQDHSIDLPEQYQLISRMSVGGMGAIYKGRHRNTNAIVAIKILHAHVADQSSNRQRFEREAKAAAALKHPNLVVIHDYGLTKEKEIPYLVMEMIEGITLQDEFGRHGGLPPGRFFHIFDQVCSALSHAHSRGVIHRDIKPSNILIMQSSETPDVVKVVDFGIAKVIDPRGSSAQELTQTGDLLGSPMYMSPEQCLGEELDERTDIYSLGCVMYQAITGKPPIVGENVVKTIFKHINVVPEPFSVAKPGITVPSAVERVIFCALEKKPSNRFRNMDLLRSALTNARQTIAS